MNKHYYVIKSFMNNPNGWDDDDMIYMYIHGTSTYYDWTDLIDDARKFKSITEIRTFITNALKNSDNTCDINAWVFQGIFTVPSSDIITSSHTMGLLRSVK